MNASPGMWIFNESIKNSSLKNYSMSERQQSDIIVGVLLMVCTSELNPESVWQVSECQSFKSCLCIYVHFQLIV